MLAGVAGLPVADISFSGVYCSDADPLTLRVTAIAPSDEVNAYNASAAGGLRRRLGASGGSLVSSAGMVVVVQVSGVPYSAAQLGPSLTGLPAVAALTGVENVLARVGVLMGNVSAWFAAAAAGDGDAVVVNVTAIDSAVLSASTLWLTASGQTVNATAPATLTIVSVAHGPAVNSTSTLATGDGGSGRNLAWIAGVVIAGMVMWGSATCFWMALAGRTVTRKKAEGA